MNRLKKKTDNNGEILEDYEYTISPTENEEVLTNVSFPNDQYGLSSIHKKNISNIDELYAIEKVNYGNEFFGLVSKNPG